MSLFIPDKLRYSFAGRVGLGPVAKMETKNLKRTGWQRYWSRWLPATKHDLEMLGNQIMALKEEIEALKATVAKNTKVSTSAVELITGIAQQLRDLIEGGAVDPADVKALANELDASAGSLAAAVEANTTPRQ